MPYAACIRLMRRAPKCRAAYALSAASIDPAESPNRTAQATTTQYAGAMAVRSRPAVDMTTLAARSRPRPIRAAAQVQLVVETRVAATPNGRTRVSAASGWLKVIRMKGQATPSMLSGRAMAKKASRARMNTTGTLSRGLKATAESADQVVRRGSAGAGHLR